MAILEKLDNFFIPASGYTGCDVVDVDVDIDDNAPERQKMGKKITILKLMERQKFFS